MSFKPEVFVDNEWCANDLVFATKEEAETSAKNLFNRWTLYKDWRAVESTEFPNYTLHNGQMIHCQELL